MTKLWCLLLGFLLFAHSSESQQNWKEKTEQPAYMHRALKELTDVMVYDIYSPPVASRIYAYTSIAAYEAAVAGTGYYQSFAGQLHGLTPLQQPEVNQDFSNTLASVYALLYVGKSLVISEDRIATFREKMMEEFMAAGIPEDVYLRSVKYGQQVAEHILAWAAKDFYKESRSLPIYAVTYDASAWKPTPPAYMKAVEPNWGKIRTFLIDSARQFKSLAPTAFSEDQKSRFYKEALAVYEIGNKLTDQQKEIASFWDCNPFKMNVNGHVMYATKKISPGGHWMNIARLACLQTNADIARSAEAYACLAITIADAFISCWEEKYRTNVIRPETYINQYIDSDWMPLLQTPPFPEYTSGHSVVSAASAKILTKLFGDNFSFSDSTELEFGLPTRNFTSFAHAAEEAAISRFYGGIHYMPAIVNGLKVGADMGSFIAHKLINRYENSAFKK
jgi:hypothetical protein